MATNQPLPDREPPRAPSETASQQIAASLRRGRLTLLCSETGAESSELLIDGVLPQLRRRIDDTAVSIAKRPLETLTPSPDRRARGAAALAELAILVSDWGTPSQASLHDGIDAALRAAGVDPEWHREPLTDRVQSLASRFGARFLFVLDGFDAVLESTDHPEARADLLGELVHLLNTPAPVNLLIALRAAAEPLMAPVLERLHAVRAEVLMLEGGRTRRVYGPAAAPTAKTTLNTPTAPATPTPPTPLRSSTASDSPTPTAPPAPRAAVKPKPTLLAQFDSAHMPEAANTGAPTRPGALGQPTRQPHDRPARAVPAFTAPPVTAPRRIPARRLSAIASVALASIVGGAVLFGTALPGGSNAPADTAASAATIAAALSASPLPPAAKAMPEPAPTPAPNSTPANQAPPEPTLAAPAPPKAALPSPVAPLVATAPRPSFALRVDADNAATRLPRELMQALAADDGAALQIVPTSLALPATGAPGDSPGLAIVRYDALQAAARSAAKPDLAVVAPLYTEELQIAVRADSPLQFIHQLEGRRINVGAAPGARALTARALYRQMFDRPLPAAPQGMLDAAPALQQLLAGGGLDAVVLVGPQPAAALAALPPAQRSGIKLLALAPENAASRRALQAYLPATLRDPAGGITPSLAAMSFLVTTGTPDADTAKALAQVTTSLCHHLPTLQRDGDAKWRTLRAGLQLETGWPQAGAAEAAWRACATAGASAAVTSSSPAPHRN